jgi:hypothetical protein
MNALEWLAAVIPGLVIGLATLPWKHKINPGDGVAIYVLAWVCFWPFGLIFSAYHGALAYRQAWWDYQTRRQIAKHHK